MATLTDTFLADLDELSDGEPEEKEKEVELKPDDGDEFMDLSTMGYDDIHSIAKLSESQRYKDVLQQVRDEVEKHGDEMPASWSGPSEDDPTYRLIVTCNELVVAIDNEIHNVHNFIKDKYKKRFPELESLVHHPVDYARVVQRIGNEEDVTTVELGDVLPQSMVMVVSVTASTTNGTALPQSELDRINEACTMMVQLDADRVVILKFVETRMAIVAPNLSLCIGTEVAAKLVGAAGGLAKLSEIPACNILVLGQRKKVNAGMSSATVGVNQGYVWGCDIIQNTPPELRKKAARLIANKVALLARFDAHSHQRDGDDGQRMRTGIEETIEKWQEPPPAKIVRPLPAPDMEQKKRRGGKRWRKQKERLATTEMMKFANRMKFNEAEEEYIDMDETFGLGMLGKEGHGKLKIMQAASKISKKIKLQHKKGGAGSASGMASSLAFSHVQGIELENPDRENPLQNDTHDPGIATGTESYFSELSGFRTLRKL